MKTCTKCQIEKSEEEFAWQRGKRRASCKECGRAAQKEYYERDPSKDKSRMARIRRRNREFIWQYYSTHPCVDCGEARPECLEFHHENGVTKRDNVGRLAHNTVSLDTIQAEIDKCIVLCANCHRVRTAAIQGWYAQGYVNRLGPWHGSFVPDPDGLDL